MGSSPQERCPLSCRVLGVDQLGGQGRGALQWPNSAVWELCWCCQQTLHGNTGWGTRSGPPRGVSAGLFLSSSHQGAAGIVLLPCRWAGRVGYGDGDENGDGEEDGDGEEVSQRTLSSPWDNQCSQLRGDCLTPETSQPGWTWGNSPAL